MNKLPRPQDGNFLHSNALLLAEFIDSTAGGHPLVSGMPSNVAEGILWQYSNHDFIIYADSRRRKFPTQIQLSKGSPSNIYLSSYEEALELIRLTESTRQHTTYPHVLFGRMPGTVFKEVR